MSTPRDPRKLKPSPALARLAGGPPKPIRSQLQAWQCDELQEFVGKVSREEAPNG